MMNVRNLTSLEELKQFLKDYFKDYDVRVYLFGSRARGDNSEFSDVDLAIFSQNDISKQITLLKALLEESNLPFKVDIIDLNKAPYLRKTIEKEGIRWV